MNEKQNKKLTHRFIARVLLEAETPIFVGSGELGLLRDSLATKDHLGLPMIPGTSLAGVLRHALKRRVDVDAIFGFQSDNKGLGSRVRISSAYLCISKNKIATEPSDVPKDVKLKFDNLPLRDHVRINEKGVATDKGKFDNEVVYAGSNFIFEIELRGTGEDEKVWKSLLGILSSPMIRIGQGTRKGYGKLRASILADGRFDLTDRNDFEAYLNLSPCLNDTLESNKVINYIDEDNSSYIHYRLNLKPDSFFMFSSGFGDKEVDNKPVEEEVVSYSKDTINFTKKTLMPASSIKGALSHRVCFHYNKLKKLWAETGAGKVGIDNDAVYELFGAAIDKKNEAKPGKKGKLIINDQYIDTDNNKIFNHVAIDRFTGGALDGALFSEKASLGIDKKIAIDLFLLGSDIEDSIVQSLENALEDICKGLLPLGGMTTKGNGIFTGELLKNKDVIYPKP